MIRLKESILDCLRSVDWEELYKQKMQLLDIINFISNNTDLLYEHLNEIYNNDVGQEGEPVEIDVDATINALEGITNLLDNLQDSAEEDGLWKHPLSDTIDG